MLSQIFLIILRLKSSQRLYLLLHPINRLVAMVQKEVALKLCSEEKSPLKMMIDYVGDVQYELNVPRHVFMPAPHVDSAVISIHKERVISQELII